MAANRMEAIKAEADGLSVRERLDEYARRGFGAITDQDRQRLKWYGLYVHRPPEEGRFMLRVRVPGGRLALEQARRLAALAEERCGGRLDLTTRQDVQLHNVRIEDVPAIFARLDDVGLGSVHACGDTPRNVVACPLAGDEPGAPGWAGRVAGELTSALVGRAEFSNLPRKFKVGVSTCRRDCVVARIHDVGLRLAARDGRAGFDLYVGGGLAAKPRLAERLGAFVPTGEVVEVVTAIARLFREEGYRERRSRARLKFLMEDWGPARFRQALEGRLGRPLTDAGPPDEGELRAPADHLGTLPARDPGRVHLGVAVPAGVLSAGQLRTLAACGAAELRVTAHQNVVAARIPRARLAGALKAVEAAGLSADRDDWAGCVETCTGMDFCPRALAYTKPAAREIAAALNRKLPDAERVRIHLTGCPNSCGRVQLAELGLSGRREGFEVWAGARAGAGTRLAEPTGWRVPTRQAADAVVAAVRLYAEQRREDETFTDFAERAGPDRLRMAGEGSP